MRVFVECRYCEEEIKLESVYEIPTEYPRTIQLECDNGHQVVYTRQELKARSDASSTAAGAILGGAAGALAGPLGVAIGSGVGSLVGQNIDQQEQEKVRNFNNFYP